MLNKIKIIKLNLPGADFATRLARRQSSLDHRLMKGSPLLLSRIFEQPEIAKRDTYRRRSDA